MKRLLSILLLFTIPVCSQEQSRRLWISGDLAYAATAPIANTDRPFGNMMLGLTLEQELPYKLAIVTGYKFQSHTACIPESDIKTRTAWEYNGIGYSRNYMQIPLQLRWKLPIAEWGVKHTRQPGKNTIYVAPHTGIDFNMGRKGWFFGEGTVSEELVNMHKYPEKFFVTGEVGLSLGFETMGLFRIEPFIAYTFHGGRLIDFSLEAPYFASRTYSKYNTFQAGFRISVCLIDWERTGAERVAAKARTVAYKQGKNKNK